MAGGWVYNNGVWTEYDEEGYPVTLDDSWVNHLPIGESYREQEPVSGVPGELIVSDETGHFRYPL